MKSMQLLLLMMALVPFSFAQANSEAPDAETTNIIEELNPFDPNIEETLQELDRIYEEETGLSPHIVEGEMNTGGEFDVLANGCRKTSCPVYIKIDKSLQRAYLYLHGRYQDEWAVSTGVSGYRTPNFEKHPNGRIYDAYTSSKYPGGDWNGLGNMPYAVFIRGGFAMHGTPKSNWPKLGSPASHGCIRMHPTNAKRVNRLIRQYGIYKTWISVY